MIRKNWLICYDIRDPKRLQRVAKSMMRWATRVQKSIFEANLADDELTTLRSDIAVEMKLSEDSARFYLICAACQSQTIRQGVAIVSNFEDFEVI